MESWSKTGREPNLFGVTERLSGGGCCGVKLRFQCKRSSSRLRQFRKRINFSAPFSKKECKSHFFVSVMRQKRSASFLEAETFNMRIWVKRFHEDVVTSKPPFFAAAVLCSAHAHSSWTSITRWTQGMKAVHSISLKPGWGSRGKQSGLRLFQASESRWRQEWWMINDIWWRQTVSRL